MRAMLALVSVALLAAAAPARAATDADLLRRHAPAAWNAGARSCAAGPPGYPWWAPAGLGVLAALLLALPLARRLRGRASLAC